MELYNGPIIDTHHHLWRRKDVVWINPPLTPKMFGDYFGLCRDYSVEEWKHDIAPHNVVKTVHVTANWAGTKATRALDETRWLSSVQAEHGYPQGIAVQADLTEPDVEAQLEEQRKFRGVCGVRHQLYWDSRPLMQYAPRPDLCNTPQFRKNFALLEKFGLHFELQVFASQVQYAVELVRDFPNVKFIVLHAGMLTDRSSHMIAQWREALMQLASYPNVHVKISGLAMFSFGWTEAQLRQVIRDSIQIFGVERTIFGSNFPLEKLYSSYAGLIRTYKKILSEYSPAAQRAIFHDNGDAFYRLS
jgi:predicted TIM-barrel fold metal-dependent hydrolase